MALGPRRPDELECGQGEDDEVEAHTVDKGSRENPAIR
jgi:hypothetical protein